MDGFANSIAYLRFYLLLVFIKKKLAITCKIVFERCRNGGKRNTDTIPYFYLKLKGNAGAPFSTVLIFKFRWKAPSKLCYAKMLTTASNSM